MDLNNQLNRKSSKISESTINNIRKEYRLHYFHPVELYNRSEDDLLYFETSKFLFYGYAVDNIKTSYDSEKRSGDVITNYLGIMMFYGGETYIGEFNNIFRPHGEGMMFFSVGAVLRGYFDDGKLHGNALVSLPFEVNVLARLDKGVIHKQLVKIDFKSNIVNYLKYVQGNFMEYEKESFIDEDLINHIKDSMGTNLTPDNIHSYNDGSLYFGTFVKRSDSLYFGFVKNGNPVGWGIVVDITTLNIKESKYFQDSLSWRLSNNLNEPDSIAVGINQENNMIFGLESGGVLYGELGVFNPKENRFQKAVIKNNDLDFDPEFFEGIQKNFVTGLYLEYLKNKRLPKRELNIVPIVFDLTYFNDLFFFYLYGHLKEKSREIFKDNLQLSQEGFFKAHMTMDSDTNMISDSIGNNIDLKNRMNSEDLTLFDFQQGNKNRVIQGVQSEVNRILSPKSDRFNYNNNSEDVDEVNKKLSKTHGLSDNTLRRKSTFLKHDYKISKTSQNKNKDNLIVIEELNEDFRRSTKSKDVKSILANMNKNKLPVLDFVESYKEEESQPVLLIEKYNQGIQSQVGRSNYEQEKDSEPQFKHIKPEYNKTKQYEYTNHMEVENTEEILELDTIQQPLYLKPSKRQDALKYKDKSTLISEIKSKFNFLLPQEYMKQLAETNSKFFGS